MRSVKNFVGRYPLCSIFGTWPKEKQASKPRISFLWYLLGLKDTRVPLYDTRTCGLSQDTPRRIQIEAGGRSFRRTHQDL
jgi:hypothetical protein